MQFYYIFILLQKIYSKSKNYIKFQCTWIYRKYCAYVYKHFTRQLKLTICLFDC